MRHVVLVLVVVVLGLAVWWCASLATANETVPSAPVGGAPQLLLAEAGAAMVDAAPVAATQRQAVAAPVGEMPSDAQEVRLRVVDAETHKPIPDVEVCWIDATFDRNKLSAAEQELRSRDHEQFVLQLGHRAVSDQQGRVVLRAVRYLSAMARRDAWFGKAHWNPNSPDNSEAPYAGEVLLLFYPDHSFFVRAVDELRQPVAGVRVQLEQEFALPTGMTRRELSEVGRTGPDGLVERLHAQELVRGGAAATALCACITGAVGEPVAIDLAHLPTDPVEVVVPSFGVVEFTLLGPDGRPWSLPEPSMLHVMLSPAGWKGGEMAGGNSNTQRLGTDGRATFPHVGCGLQFEVRAWDGWFERVVFDGPVRRGDRVAIDLRMASDVRLLAGRLLSDDGIPFVGEALLSIADRGGSAGQVLYRDAAGRFCVPVMAFLGDDLSLTVVELAGGRPSVHQVEVVLRAPLVAGRNELGDVVLGAAPLLVSGQVVWPAGAVRGAASVEIQRRQPGEGESWQRANDLRVVIDAEQRFEVRALAKSAAFRLVVRGDCAQSEPLEFQPGTEGLQVDVATGSSVTATFLADSVYSQLSFRLLAKRASKVDRADSMLRPFREEGYAGGERLRVSWIGLTVGEHQLLVFCPGQLPLVDLTIDVPKGAPADDERLLDIDLRGRTRMVAVQVTLADETPFSGEATVALRGPADGGVRWCGHRFDRQMAQGVHFLLGQPTDVFVVAPGYRGVLVAGVFGETKVALHRAPEVTIQWVGAPALPDGVSATLRWSLPSLPANGPMLEVSGAGGSHTGAAWQTLLGKGLPTQLVDGRASASIEAALPMQLELRLAKQGRPSQVVAAPVLLDPAHLVEGQVIELRADAAMVGRALRVLKED